MFKHLLLRDYFANRFAIMNIYNTNFYASSNGLLAFHMEPNPMRALAKLNGSNTTRIIREVMLHKNPRIRRSAVESLTFISDLSGLDILLSALDDNDTYVQAQAVEALTRIGTPEALEAVRGWREQQAGGGGAG